MKIQPKPFRILGVLNATPDSFSDGSLFESEENAVAHARHLFAEGADFVDIGAESTRPGANPVDADLEWKRLEPIVLGIGREFSFARISVDTQKPEIMLRCARLGVGMINCVAGVVDGGPWLEELAKVGHLEFIAMQMTGTPKTMQKHPDNAASAIPTIEAAFRTFHARLSRAGFTEERIWLDPGVGFGKDDSANAAILRSYPRWASEYNVVAAVSRKSFLGRLLGIDEPAARDDASNMLEIGLISAGARIVRTHRVGPLVKFRDHMR